MAIRLTSTAESSDFIKCIVYGESGVGKTWICKTAPNPVIISAEKGLLTLKREKINVIEISSFQDLEDALDFVTNDKRAAGFKTICLDSISDIAETVLGEEKANCGADPRAAYGAYADKLLPLIKKFRDIEGKHVYFTAKLKKVKDDFTGITSYGPSMPGQQLGPQLPYLFDFVFALRMGEDEEGKKFRYLQTEADIQYIAKARGGTMDPIEPPDLTHIFDRALSYELAEDREPEDDSEEKREVVVEGGFEGTEGEDSEVDEEKVVEGSSDEIPDDEEIAEEGAEEDVQKGDDSSLDEAAEASMEE